MSDCLRSSKTEPRDCLVWSKVDFPLGWAPEPEFSQVLKQCRWFCFGILVCRIHGYSSHTPSHFRHHAWLLFSCSFWVQTFTGALLPESSSGVSSEHCSRGFVEHPDVPLCSHCSAATFSMFVSFWLPDHGRWPEPETSVVWPSFRLLLLL